MLMLRKVLCKNERVLFLIYFNQNCCRSRTQREGEQTQGEQREEKIDGQKNRTITKTRQVAKTKNDQRGFEYFLLIFEFEFEFMICDLDLDWIWILIFFF
jgi:hypothetical protein